MKRKIGKMMSALLVVVLCIICAIPVVNATENTGIELPQKLAYLQEGLSKEAAEQYLKLILEKADDQSDYDDEDDPIYEDKKAAFIYDINDDGILELVLNEVDASDDDYCWGFSVYQFKNGEIKTLIDFEPAVQPAYGYGCALVVNLEKKPTLVKYVNNGVIETKGDGRSYYRGTKEITIYDAKLKKTDIYKYVWSDLNDKKEYFKNNGTISKSKFEKELLNFGIDLSSNLFEMQDITMREMTSALELIAASDGISSVNSAKKPLIEARPEAIAAGMDDNNKAFIPLMDGTVVELPGELFDAALAPDHNTIVALSLSGDLSFCSVKNTKMKKIAGNVVSYVYPTENNVVYRDEKGVVYRYTFKTQEILKLGPIDAGDTTSSGDIIYATKGKVFFLASSAKSAKKIAEYSGLAMSMSMTEDGKTAAWLDEKDGKADLYLYMNEKVEKLDVLVDTISIVSMGASVDLISNKDCSASILAVPKYMMWGKSADAHFPLFIQAEGQNKKVGSLYLRRHFMYTKNGPFEYDTQNSEIYASVNDYVNSEEQSFLVKIGKMGNYDVIRKDVRFFCIDDGVIFFTDSNNHLFYAELTENGIKNEIKVADDVMQLTIPPNGQYAVFASSTKENSYALGWVNHNGESKIFDEQAADFIWPSIEGDKVYYMAQLGEHSDVQHGILREYDFMTQKITTIDEDVIAGSLNSGLSNGINAKGFMYERFIENEGSTVYADWIFFDGSEGKIVAERIIHPQYSD